MLDMYTMVDKGKTEESITLQLKIFRASYIFGFDFSCKLQ